MSTYRHHGAHNLQTCLLLPLINEFLRDQTSPTGQLDECVVCLPPSKWICYCSCQQLTCFWGMVPCALPNGQHVNTHTHTHVKEREKSTMTGSEGRNGRGSRGRGADLGFWSDVFNNGDVTLYLTEQAAEGFVALQARLWSHTHTHTEEAVLVLMKLWGP